MTSFSNALGVPEAASHNRADGVSKYAGYERPASIGQMGGTYQCGYPTSAGGCAGINASSSRPLPNGPTMHRPSVYNFGDARNLRLSFTQWDRVGPLPFDGPDFVADPAVAIVSDPAGQGYVVVRAQGPAFGAA